MDVEDKITELEECLEIIESLQEKLMSIREAKKVYDRIDKCENLIEEIIEELRDNDEDNWD